MNHKILIAFAAAGFLAAGLAGGYWIASRRPMAEMNPKAEAPIADARKPLYYHDPMNPQQKFDKPGKSPFMDMQLVPVYADSTGDSNSVAINPRVQQNLGTRTAEVSKGTIVQFIEAVGNVMYNEREVAVVQARNNGYVEKLLVRAPLDPVRKGQPLAELYVPDWVATQEEYLALRRVAGNHPDGLVGGARERMRQAGMSETQIQLVESTNKVQPRLTVIAPIGGVVGELTAREGMTVMTGGPLFRINGLSTVWVNAEITESRSNLIRPGNAVVARASALPGVIFNGHVSTILPEVNATTRTLKARIELANPGGRLVPGMFATVSFTPAAAAEVLLVPTEAVIQTGKRSVVVVSQDNGRFAPVDVEIGVESNGRTEIRKGLQAGQKVVISGQFLIDSEASLKTTETRMSDAPMGMQDGEPKMDKIPANSPPGAKP